MTVRECMYPEGLANLGKLGEEFADMSIEEFVEAYRAHRALPNYNGKTGAAMANSQEVFARGSAMQAVADNMGLPTDADNLYTVPGPGWVCRKDLEAGQ